MPEIDISGNYSQTFWDFLRGDNCGFGCPNGTLLAKTIML